MPSILLIALSLSFSFAFRCINSNIFYNNFDLLFIFLCHHRLTPPMTPLIVVWRIKAEAVEASPVLFNISLTVLLRLGQAGVNWFLYRCSSQHCTASFSSPSHLADPPPLCIPLFWHFPLGHSTWPFSVARRH